MLDNKGWGLQAMIGFTAILFIALLIVIIQIQKGFKELEHMSNTQTNPTENGSVMTPNYQSYEDIELAMIKSASSYVSKYYSEDFLEGDKVTVTLKSLQREKLIGMINDLKNKTMECTGYVTFIKENNIINYSPYLKCGHSYTTKGYLERLDELGS